MPEQSNAENAPHALPLQVRVPTEEEVGMFKDGSTVFSFLYPNQNQAIVDKMMSKKMTAFAMEMVPRISRAQVRPPRAPPLFPSHQRLMLTIPLLLAAAAGL